MTLFVSLFFAIIPGLAWLWYFLAQKDKVENSKLVTKLFFFGALATIPVIVIEYAIGSVFGSIADELARATLLAIFVVAPIEEIAKYIIVKEFATGEKNIREAKDALVYGATVGLGFATLENIFAFTEVNLQILIVRGLTTTLLHAFTGAVIGYYANQKGRYKTGIAIAIIFHILFNLSIIFYVNLLITGIVVIVLTVAMISILFSLKNSQKPTQN